MMSAEDEVLGRCQHHRLTSVMVAMNPRAGWCQKVAVLFLIPIPVGLAVSWGAKTPQKRNGGWNGEVRAGMEQWLSVMQ